MLGQRTEPVFIGCEHPVTRERTVLEIIGKPMRDSSGLGEHIGGIITLRDVTDERKKRTEDIQEQGDAYFKQTCDAMPQLVWVTTPTGYHEVSAAAARD